VGWLLALVGGGRGGKGWLVGWFGGSVGGYRWWATDKTPVGRGERLASKSISHANVLDFPPPWPGHLCAKAESCQPRFGTSRPEFLSAVSYASWAPLSRLKTPSTICRRSGVRTRSVSKNGAIQDWASRMTM
jgi:hypothetical protein